MWKRRKEDETVSIEELRPKNDDNSDQCASLNESN